MINKQHKEGILIMKAISKETITCLTAREGNLTPVLFLSLL